jgi:cation transport ATPase
MATIQNVVMDKTGTMTVFKVQEVVFKPDFNKDENTSNGQCLGKHTSSSKQPFINMLEN